MNREINLGKFEEDIDSFAELEMRLKEQNKFLFEQYEKDREEELKYPIQERIYLDVSSQKSEEVERLKNV